ncbi:hypothetical protein K435DRAFT_528466 [Dendrothele bispora CBS 962.96]|uniref:C2H2-type domain-containing protein n=1 Tax=Dendrothele bispora (strain CBS 962.96) TaxID=1314807 RepID=A0A4V4HBH2_DENBC|nr:hypothetical protein K435DRAFT_528466 [Dendrothele bispora CBS 962.96]
MSPVTSPSQQTLQETLITWRKCKAYLIIQMPADSPDIHTPGTPESVQDNHTSVVKTPRNFTIVSQRRNSQFPCRTCDRVFTREYTRKVHEDAHATRAAGPLLCREPDCNTTFSRSHDRLRHEVRIHGHEAHTCAICNNMFSSLKSLQKHQCKCSGTSS